MKYLKTITVIFIFLLLVMSSGCISIPAMPKIQPIQVPVQKPPSAYVEMKDINYNQTTHTNTSVNVTPTIPPTPTPTSRFVYV
jgi:hypothetical protein